MKLKNDKYKKRRSGQSYFLEIYCKNCDSYILLYQKDGKGALHRLYFNRIFEPEDLSLLQNNKYDSLSDISDLVCEDCNSILGVPMIHSDGRFAFRLIKDNLYKKRKKI